MQLKEDQIKRQQQQSKRKHVSQAHDHSKSAARRFFWAKGVQITCAFCIRQNGVQKAQYIAPLNNQSINIWSYVHEYEVATKHSRDWLASVLECIHEYTLQSAISLGKSVVVLGSQVRVVSAHYI
jgi:hypothetical protein